MKIACIVTIIQVERPKNLGSIPRKNKFLSVHWNIWPAWTYTGFNSVGTGWSGDRGSTVVKVLCYKSEGRWFDPRRCQWDFSLTYSFRSHYGPGVDSASNINDYKEYFLVVKAAGAWGWQPHHHPVPLSCNLGTLTSWNPLGHSRPVTGLFYLYLYWLIFSRGKAARLQADHPHLVLSVRLSGVMTPLAHMHRSKFSFTLTM
jgi:hypothetical protein